jgi:predicted transcriptional regulator
MKKRGRLEIIKDILRIIQENKNSIKQTPLIRKSNISSSKSKEYFKELLDKGFVREIRSDSGEKTLALTQRGFNFLERYKTIVNFIEEFEL